MTMINAIEIKAERAAPRRAACGILALTLLTVGACAADEPLTAAGGDDQLGAEPQAQLFPWPRGGGITRDGGITGRDAGTAPSGPLLPTISSAGKFTGSLCGEEQAIDSSSGAFRVDLSAPLDNSENLNGRISGACSAGLDVTIPAGFRAVAPQVCARVILQAPENDDASAKVTVRVSFDGGTVGTKTQQLNGSTAHVVCTAFPTVQTACNASGPTKAKLSVSVGVEAGPETFAQLSSIDGDLSYQQGAEWRSCSSSARLPTPQDGESCAGPNRLRCATGLRCENTSSDGAWQIGTCR